MKNNLKSTQLFLGGADKLIIGEKLMIALNQIIGLAGQALLMAPAGLEIIDKADSLLTSPQDCFIDASTTANGLLPSLTAFGVNTKPLEEAIRTEPQFLRRTATDPAWADKRRQLAQALAGIPEGAFVQAALETRSALQWQLAPLHEGARIFLGEISLPTLKPVPVISIPFDAKVDTSLILPALVTRDSQLRYFCDLASALQFLNNVFGTGENYDSKLVQECTHTHISWEGPYSAFADIMRGRGYIFLETEEEKLALEGKYPILDPYSRISLQEKPKRSDHGVNVSETRELYVVYEFDEKDRLKLARVTAVSAFRGRSLGPEVPENWGATGYRNKNILQLFTAGE